MERKLYGTVLIKAADILDTLADGKSKSIQEIAVQTQIGAPTVSKILTTLEYLHYVSKAEATKHYSLGSKLVQFGLVHTQTTDIVDMTFPMLEKLQSKIDETIHLAVPQGDKVVYVNKLEPKHQGIYMTSKIGMTRELYSSGIGKAVLSTLSDKKIDQYLKRTDLKPFTKHTITNSLELKEDIEKTRKRGYAIDNEEQEDGGYCIAMPIRKAGKAIAAMSISIPKFRLTTPYKTEIVKDLNVAKSNIEDELNK
ncbi:IclR family transcriptional regulator [Lentilactobacillus buchneri]|uniref:IclR family transcriptional regulator n=1 Tax=Lentilactobacillus buchneri TaxID=1581 RepID=UPI00129214B4|nr:IclR family transcriptional regulator [Lentilactobacillus buchneri]MDS1016594.1 IclR family transcriptional regulator [Lentilactobacillus buchneri]MQM59267.1 IclR family transcriptional regulator [Lentilactobacillus buchneri]MQM76626.1 IclR family transcriptional regulator [Lentilactobacillus buchneri]MQM86695.1 IclR family transcriptional regulator [Lentilactobacillus buchneri]MQN21160.1 IclR family transcriptional regulator [Lentilactobacillus buchneri]